MFKGVKDHASQKLQQAEMSLPFAKKIHMYFLQKEEWYAWR